MGGTLISARILEQIQLVIFLRVPPLGDRGNLRDDLLAFRSEILRLDFCCHLPGNRFLLWGMKENPGSILGARISALLIQRGGVVSAIEEFNKIGITDHTGIKLNPQSLRMISCSSTHALVCGVCHEWVSTSVSNRSLEDSFVLGGWKVFEKDVFDAPEAAVRECRNLWFTT